MPKIYLTVTLSCLKLTICCVVLP